MTYTKQQLIDTRSFLIDLSFDNLDFGDIETALRCCRLLKTVDGLLEGGRVVREESKEELMKFIQEMK